MTFHDTEGLREVDTSRYCCDGNCRQGRDCSCWPEDPYRPSLLGKRAFYIAGAISLGLWLAVTASVAWALA